MRWLRRVTARAVIDAHGVGAVGETQGAYSLSPGLKGLAIGLAKPDQAAEGFYSPPLVLAGEPWVQGATGPGGARRVRGALLAQLPEPQETISRVFGFRLDALLSLPNPFGDQSAIVLVGEIPKGRRLGQG